MSRHAVTRGIALIAVSMLVLTACGNGDPDDAGTDLPAVDGPGEPADADRVDQEPTLGDPVLRTQWAQLIADVGEDDVTPTVIELHGLLDHRLPIIDIDPATGPWTITRTTREPTLRCHADAALTAIVALRQHDASGQATLGPEIFASLQSDIAAYAPTAGWQLGTESQFVPGHPAYDDGVRGTIHRLEGHGEVWLVTVSYEPDVVTTINYCPAELGPLPEPLDTQTAIEQARDAITRGEYADALRLVERALATDPANRELQILAYARHGDELLHAAFWDDDEEAVATLAAIVPDVDQPDARFGSSALLLAAVWGRTGMVQVLLEAGADPNASADTDGLTVLMWAAKHFDEQLDMTRMLLEAGADVHARSDFGETALSIAEEYLNPNVAALLRQYGATE